MSKFLFVCNEFSEVELKVEKWLSTCKFLVLYQLGSYNASQNTLVSSLLCEICKDNCFVWAQTTHCVFSCYTLSTLQPQSASVHLDLWAQYEAVVTFKMLSPAVGKM